ncbi:MAG: ZIP family metal transporter [Flavobacteriales bacterium]|nr:MAG: ZIP family metal transporter [Flavobacteriales bacterium]
MNIFILILSVVIGVLIIKLLRPKFNDIQLLLSFSGAYLLSITILHLLPDVFNDTDNLIGLYILAGVILQTVLEFFSKGVEHGHVHLKEKATIPATLLLSLYIHAFTEGIPLYHQHSHSLLWAIAIHKIPVAAVFYVFLIRANISNFLIILFISLFAIMSPLGYLTSDYITFFNTYNKEITAIVVGIFLHVATAILFESSQDHKFHLKKFLAIIIGFLIALIGIL